MACTYLKVLKNKTHHLNKSSPTPAEYQVQMLASTGESLPSKQMLHFLCFKGTSKMKATYSQHKQQKIQTTLSGVLLSDCSLCYVRFKITAL